MPWEDSLVAESAWSEAAGSSWGRHLEAELEDDRPGHQGVGVWLIFWSVFVALALLDMCCLAPRAGKDSETSMSGRIAIAHCSFWFVIGLIFNLVVWNLSGPEMAFVWLNGYILEYLLSMDNVFFFHVVFKAYGTPPAQMYKGLFLGILGAVVLRLLFYFVGAGVFRLAFVFQIFFGLVLVYSGFKTAVSDEDDDDPREMRCVQCLMRLLPLTNFYEDSGALFTRACEPPPQANGAELSPGLDGMEPAAQVVGATNGHAEIELSAAHLETGIDDSIGISNLGPSSQSRLRGTMLLLVVVVLQVIDVVFAVDSVTAKIAEHDSIFINFTSSAFAMLCLRSMYFVLTRMLQYFRFLKYGVALILVLIGVKLIISPWVEIESIYSLVTISGTFALSIGLSAALPAPSEEEEAAEEEEAKAAIDTPGGGKGQGDMVIDDVDANASRSAAVDVDTSRLSEDLDWEYSEDIKPMY